MSADMDGDTLKRDTITILSGGIEFLSKLPKFRGALEQVKEELERSWQELLDRWNLVKSVVIKKADEQPKEKPLTETKMLKFNTLPIRKKRSASSNDVFAVSQPIYDNVKLGEVLKQPTRKRSFLMKFNIGSSLSSHKIPSSDGTVKSFQSLSFDMDAFTMTSDGRFDLTINGISLQVGAEKMSNLYCCLQSTYLLFGRKLNGQAPLRIINLEACELLEKTGKKTIQLKNAETLYSILFPHSSDCKFWKEKIQPISVKYVYVSDEHSLDPVYSTIREGPQADYVVSSIRDSSELDMYSYIREERHIGGDIGEYGYSYVNSLNCVDCHTSVERKVSNAEAVTDLRYLNVMKGVDTARIKDVKSLISHYS